MTAANFQTCLTVILKSEGGLVDNPRDPGGLTNLGVTQATLSHWLGRSASADEVKALTPATVAPIYHALYWNAVQGDALPVGVDLVVFDMAVNSGPKRAIETLQTAVGATVDGALGPHTLLGVGAMSASDLIHKFTDAHEAFYRSLSTFPTFGRGWIARCNTTAQVALNMANVG